jgi:sulfoquinovosidase
VSVDISGNPFKLVVRGKDGRTLLESADLPEPKDEADPLRSYAPFAMTHNTDESVRAIGFGWSYYRGTDDPWKRGTRAVSVQSTSDALNVVLETNDAVHSRATLTVTTQGIGAHLVLTPDPGPAGDVAPVNRVSLAFKMHDDDHFFGFGERFVRMDHRGQLLYNWVEDGGLGQGADAPPGDANPFPSGEGETNIPIPWFLSPKGFGMLVNTTFRSVHHLGDQTPDAFRVEAWTGKLDLTVFADPDPMRLVEALTEVTGRPPEVADWAFAPRRRANIGTDEMDKLRKAHVPTSVIDTAMHYFPNGVGDALGKPGAMKAVTDDIHRRGFKAIAYFCPFIADSFHPVFDEAASKGYLVKQQDGTPYVVLDPPYNAAMVDFTNPDAVTWYQGHLQQALDDGWDGWMYDFAEYVPQDAVMWNGMSGMEAHNLYPVLYQRAATELLEKKKPKDYLIFVRSGFMGTGGLVPMVWAGDQSTDFDLADGLPAALVGALNAGMSGIPLWGSDISGYHFIYNPPPDKELYLRWTELGAFSADMHDENEGTGHGTTADRWQIWKDDETLAAYKLYASYKTRMLPYVKIALRQARARGTPIMRHLYLSYPQDPRVATLTDEYMYGDGLLVAPVVTKGAISRKVYLPEPTYFDFFTHARVAGGGDVERPAPIGIVPVLARMGTIVPMLAADVETLIPAADGSAVSAADRAGIYEVAVFPGGDSSVTLDDGTQISQSAPTDPFVPSAPTSSRGPIPAAASAADLTTCDACAWDDPSSHTYSIALAALPNATDTIAAGPLRVTVKASGEVKRFLFTIAR